MRRPRRLTARRLTPWRLNSLICPAELPTSSDSGVITASMTPISSCGASTCCALSPRVSFSFSSATITLERGRLALQDERVAGLQHDIAGRLEAALGLRE